MKVLIDYIKDLYRFSKYKFITNLLFMILDGITNGIGILMLVPLLSLTGITGQSSIEIPVLNDALHFMKGYDNSIQLIIILSIYLLLVIMQAFISRKLSILNSEIIQGYAKYLRVSLYAYLVKAEWSCLAGKKKSDMTNTFTNEIVRIASGTIFFLRLTSQFVLTVFQLCVAFMMSVPLTLFVMLCGVIIFIYMRSTFKDSKKLGTSLRLINQELLNQIMEQLNGVKEVKSYGIEETQLQCFEEITEKTKRNLNDFTILQSKSVMFYKIGAAFVISLLFYFSVVFFKIEPAALLITIYIFARLWPVFSSFQNNIQNVLVMIPSFTSLKNMMEDLSEHAELIKPVSNSSCNKMVTGAIRFENVSFHYHNSDGFELNKLNFEIPAKSMTAFVGKSGAGKSTIVDLLLGLLKPTKGCIIADDRIIDEDSIYQWRKCIGYVPQDPFLFNTTIRENLLRFTPAASDEEINHALMIADASEFVQRLTLGIDTVIGDNGVRLSGGQRQRIVLARALLRKPEVLVLDEATSALDNESEYRIQKAVEALAGTLTVVIIAHRLSTIQNANNIFVIDQGEVVEQGTYEELIKTNDGEFKRIMEINKEIWHKSCP